MEIQITMYKYLATTILHIWNQISGVIVQVMHELENIKVLKSNQL
jgi:hypothetical protein